MQLILSAVAVGFVGIKTVYNYCKYKIANYPQTVKSLSVTGMAVTTYLETFLL